MIKYDECKVVFVSPTHFLVRCVCVLGVGGGGGGGKICSQINF